MMKCFITVPIADLRQKPIHLFPIDFSHNAQRESQLIYGEKITILQEENDWLHVSADEQPKFSFNLGWHGYRGWLHRSEVGQIKNIEKEKPFAFCKQKLIDDALRLFLDTPYLWGGKAFYSESPIGGVDCSGLIYMLYRLQERIIPRDAHDQFLRAKLINKNELEPGDLLFWAPQNYPRRITHVVIYLDKNHFLEAPFSKERVRIQPLPYDFWEKKQYYRFLGRDPLYEVFAAKFF